MRAAGAVALMALVLNAGSAWAVSQDIKLTASVGGSCTISNSTSPSVITQALGVSSDGFVSGTPVVVSFPVACNKPATMAVSTSNKGLIGPAAAANYVNRIDYHAETSGVFPAVVFDTTIAAAPLPGGGDPYSAASSGPVNGNISVTVTPVVATLPLAAGDYADTLHLTITPLQ